MCHNSQPSPERTQAETSGLRRTPHPAKPDDGQTNMIVSFDIAISSNKYPNGLSLPPNALKQYANIEDDRTNSTLGAFQFFQKVDKNT